MPRSPKPVSPPSTLTEAVLDLERRMTGGDALSEVLLPAEDWTRLVELAEDADAETDATESRIVRHTLGLSVDASPGEVRDALSRVIRDEAVASLFVDEVRKALGLSEDALRSQVVEAVSGLVGKSAAPFDPLPPAKPKRQRKTKVEASAPACVDCGVSIDGNTAGGRHEPTPLCFTCADKRAKAAECEHCGDAHASDACGLKPSEEAEDPRQMSIEEDAA